MFTEVRSSISACFSSRAFIFILSSLVTWSSLFFSCDTASYFAYNKKENYSALVGLLLRLSATELKEEYQNKAIDNRGNLKEESTYSILRTIAFNYNKVQQFEYTSCIISKILYGTEQFIFLSSDLKVTVSLFSDFSSHELSYLMLPSD